MALEGTIAILEKDLLPKEDLYKRWIGATPEEVAAHFEKGELQAYARYKGPINGVIWCKPGYISYRDCQDYLNPSLSEFHDEYCDYFLLQNVNQCEFAHPEYIGDVTLEGLGLGQPQYSFEAEGNPLHAGLATITADEAIKHLEITPIELIDELNGYQIFNDEGHAIDYRRLVTVNEEGFREYADSGFNEPFFNMRSLSSVKIYKIDLDRYCEKWEMQGRVVSDREDTAALESLLAETQSQVESLRQWNQRLNEQNQKLQKDVQEKDSSISKLENDLAVAKKASTVSACACKGLPAIVCQMRREGRNEEEIAKHLWDKGQGCSNPQIGALVHPTAKVGETTSDAMTKYAQRLLGKA